MGFQNISFEWDSQFKNVKLFVNLSWMTISVRSGVTQRSGEIVPPPGREYPSISALS